MVNRVFTKAQMTKRVSRFKDAQWNPRAFIDTVLPQFERELFGIIGTGAKEDQSIPPRIKETDGYGMSFIKCAPQKGTGLHDHTTSEVFMVLTGQWSVHWGDEGENELILDPLDAISVPAGVMRGFRNVSDETAMLLAIVSGNKPDRIIWSSQVMDAVRAKGFEFDGSGNIAEISKSEVGA